MSSTVAGLLKSAELKLTGKVKWGESVPSRSQGVYLVSLSDDPDVNNGVLDNAPVSLQNVQAWIDKVPKIQLDGMSNPTADALADRLSRYWLPDESVLYIGMTTRTLPERIGEYYKTALGERGPHAGGHWIKTLRNLEQLYVYYAECSNPKEKKAKLLRSFIDNVSGTTRSRLFDSRPLTFANLQIRGTLEYRKRHGIRYSRRRDA